MFQARHLAEIAAIISKLPSNDGLRQDVAGHFAEELKKDNPQFDTYRFAMAAMGRPAMSRDNR